MNHSKLSALLAAVGLALVLPMVVAVGKDATISVAGFGIFTGGGQVLRITQD